MFKTRQNPRKKTINYTLNLQGLPQDTIRAIERFVEALKAQRVTRQTKKVAKPIKIVFGKYHLGQVKGHLTREEIYNFL